MTSQPTDVVLEVRESLGRAFTVSELLNESHRLRQIAGQFGTPTGLFVASQVLAELARARDERPLDPKFVRSVDDQLVPLLEELLDAVADHPNKAMQETDALVSAFLTMTITPPRP